MSRSGRSGWRTRQIWPSQPPLVYLLANYEIKLLRRAAASTSIPTKYENLGPTMSARCRELGPKRYEHHEIHGPGPRQQGQTTYIRSISPANLHPRFRRKNLTA